MKFASGSNWDADKAQSDADFSATDLSINMEKYKRMVGVTPNAVHSH